MYDEYPDDLSRIVTKWASPLQLVDHAAARGIPGHDQWSGLRMGNAGSLNQIWQSNLTCSFNAKRTGHVAQVTQRSRAFTILHCTATW